MRFSVAIRTISLFSDGKAVFNVGGGIVFDSTAEAEYEECLLKARFAIGDQEIAR
jgi:para-aminobenzoate synthetase component 1